MLIEDKNYLAGMMDGILSIQFGYNTSLKEKKPLDILTENNAILAGGAITSVLTKRTVNDFDFFFPSSVEYLEVNKLLPTLNGITTEFSSQNAITYNHYDKTFQTIKVVHGTPKEIISSFDFNVAKVAYDLNTQKMEIGETFFKGIETNTLRIEKWDSHPCSIIMRLIKYHEKKGFKLLESDLIKLSIVLQAKAEICGDYEPDDEYLKWFIYNSTGKDYITIKNGIDYVNKWLGEIQ